MADFYGRNTQEHATPAYDLEASNGALMQTFTWYPAFGQTKVQARIGGADWTDVVLETGISFGITTQYSTNVVCGAAGITTVEFRSGAVTLPSFTLPSTMRFIQGITYTVSIGLQGDLDELENDILVAHWNSITPYLMGVTGNVMRIGSADFGIIPNLEASYTIVRGPWDYDVLGVSSNVASFKVATDFAATGNSSGRSGSADFSVSADVIAEGVNSDKDGASSFDVTVDLSAVGEGKLGPWNYDVSMPEYRTASYRLAVGIEASGVGQVPHSGSADFGLGLDMQASGSTYKVLVEAESDPTFEDDTVLGGLTYRYRVIDALGNVLYSNDVTFNPSSNAEVAIAVGMEAIGSASSQNHPASFDLTAGMDSVGSKNISDSIDLRITADVTASGATNPETSGSSSYNINASMSCTGKKSVASIAEFGIVTKFSAVRYIQDLGTIETGILSGAMTMGTIL